MSCLPKFHPVLLEAVNSAAPEEATPSSDNATSDAEEARKEREEVKREEKDISQSDSEGESAVDSERKES